MGLFSGFKVACLSGFLRGWRASKATKAGQRSAKEPKEETGFLTRSLASAVPGESWLSDGSVQARLWWGEVILEN
ncbi:hypothetical protein D1627_14770 [Pontibacter oryzae]|uniref:Uncharacterized protein n=1 Tax=Pontibacter oryzae TaxID=2304593 RepID=A0A399S1A8_9BACT|nr:hypothetical protein D1627_14770 [Pontibacter oryzae]